MPEPPFAPVEQAIAAGAIPGAVLGIITTPTILSLVAGGRIALDDPLTTAIPRRATVGTAHGIAPSPRHNADCRFPEGFLISAANIT